MRASLSIVAVVGVLLSVACSSSSSGSSPQDGNGNGGGSGNGGGDGNGNGGGSGQNTDGSSPTADSSTPTTSSLTCASHTYCTSDYYTAFGGQTLPAATGGKIADGLYRVGWGLKTSSGDDNGENTIGILFSGNQYLRVGFGTNDLGTFTTSGSTISFTPSADCDSEGGTALTDPAQDPYTAAFSVDANGNFLLFYADGSSAPSSVTAFIPVNGLCNEPSTPATAPGGDTVHCTVQNCGCAENTGGAADSNTCDFVDGRSS